MTCVAAASAEARTTTGVLTGRFCVAARLLRTVCTAAVAAAVGCGAVGPCPVVELENWPTPMVCVPCGVSMASAPALTAAITAWVTGSMVTLPSVPRMPMVTVLAVMRNASRLVEPITPVMKRNPPYSRLNTALLSLTRCLLYR